MSLSLRQLKKRIKSQKLESNITLLGFLPKKKVISTLKSSNVFLFTDHEAGFGLAVAEAMAAGLPIVGWDIGILGIVYRQGYIKVPIDNHNQFALAIIKLLRDARVHHQIARLARAEAARHDWQIAGRKFESILDTMSL